MGFFAWINAAGKKSGSSKTKSGGVKKDKKAKKTGRGVKTPKYDFGSDTSDDSSDDSSISSDDSSSDDSSDSFSDSDSD